MDEVARVRAAGPADADAVSRIYAEGIASRAATFETEPPTPAGMRGAIERTRPRHSFLVAEAGGQVVGWAATTPYSGRSAYDGVAEFSLYVAGAARSRGVGRLLLGELLARAEQAGLHKVTSRVITDNGASRRVCAALGFREVGVHLRHGRLDGRWRDCVTVEVLLGPAAEAARDGARD